MTPLRDETTADPARSEPTRADPTRAESTRAAIAGAGPRLADSVGRSGGVLGTVRSVLLMVRFAVVNLVSRRAVVDPAGPAVSLTSHGRRVHLVFLAIESIARGSSRPSRLILWLDDDRLAGAPPRTLRRLSRRGLEIRLAANYGPHTKYFPYVLTEPHHSVPLVTADDDWIVPRRWLETLLAAHVDEPEALVAHRVHLIELSDRAIAPYATWGAARQPLVSPLHFGTGCMGQLIPPRVLDSLRDAGDAFAATAPHADDVWIHHRALESGSGVRPVGVLPESAFSPIRGGGLGGVEPLFERNVAGGRNDLQIAATYSARALAVLAAASQASDTSPAWSGAGASRA